MGLNEIKSGFKQSFGFRDLVNSVVLLDRLIFVTAELVRPQFGKTLKSKILEVY